MGLGFSFTRLIGFAAATLLMSIFDSLGVG
jgi:hypothetical protein